MSAYAMGCIRAALHVSDDLRKPQWRGHENAAAGHCYVASEALWHFMGGQRSGWRPEVLRVDGGTHWYLRNPKMGLVMDPTADQFDHCPAYERGRPCGFLTRQPSKRAVELLKRASLRLPKGYVERLASPRRPATSSHSR